MITFTQQPKDFTPVNSGIIYTIESDEVVDFDIGILNFDTGKEVGRKHIYNSSRAVVDIAPYVANMAQEIAPKSGQTELVKAPVVKYILTVDTSNLDSEVSDTVAVSNNITTPVIGINSIFPTSQKRQLSIGDYDELRIVAQPKSILSVEITSDRGEQLSFEQYSNSGVAILNLSSADFNESTKSLTVRICHDEHLLQSIFYEVVPRRKGSMRLAWLTPTGVLERYTFPITESRAVVATDRELFVGNGGQYTSCNCVNRATLKSDIHTTATIEALSTLVTAPKVWIENEGDYHEAFISDSHATTSKFGKVTTLVVTVEYNRKEVRL